MPTPHGQDWSEGGARSVRRLAFRRDRISRQAADARRGTVAVLGCEFVPARGAETIMAVTLELPEDLEREIEKAGLLAPDAVEAIFREQLRRFHLRELLKDTREMAADNIPPMTMEEIQTEVDAVRAERQRRAAGS